MLKRKDTIMMVCYCCKEIIKDEKKFYVASVELVGIVKEQICRKPSPWVLVDMKFCSLRCVIIELVSRIKQ